MGWWPSFPAADVAAVLSPARVGKTCMKSPNLMAALDCWLKENPKISNRIEWKSGSASALKWKEWSSGRKHELHRHFWEAVNWYRQGMPATCPKPFSMPRPQSIQADPKIGFGFCMAEPVAKQVYLSHVANSLAAELMKVFPWSITSYTAGQLSLLLSYSEFFAYHSAPQTQFPGYYPQNFTLPATPYYAARFFKANSLLGPTALVTVAELFSWCRRLVHYFLEAGAQDTDWTAFWGSGSPPIGAAQLIDGTFYKGNAAFPLEHFTAGCGGTTQFMKSVLRAVNIPAEDRVGGGHHMPFFPTIDRGLSHGDDPYNQLSKVSPFSGWSVPAKPEYLITGAKWDQWFGPGVDPAKAVGNVGRQIADIAIQYQSDALLKMYCQDTEAQVSHADSKVFQSLKKYYSLAQLEAKQLWFWLEKKAASTGFCDQQP